MDKEKTDVSANDLRPLISWLGKRWQEVMACEKAGAENLGKNEIDDYRKNMRRKAELLASMAGDVAKLLADIPEPMADRIKRKLVSFSSSAATALRLDSVFYMSALLYPDDHKNGEPDNLKIFINDLVSGKIQQAWGEKP